MINKNKYYNIVLHTLTGYQASYEYCRLLEEKNNKYIFIKQTGDFMEVFKEGLWFIEYEVASEN